MSKKLVWVCTRCGERQEGNPRFCWSCAYTVYKPTWEEEVCPGAHGGQGCEDIPDGRCDAEATQTLVLVGGPFDEPPTEVPYCDRCTEHWRRYHPERIQQPTSAT